MACEDGDREAIDDDRQTEFGELVESGTLSNTSFLRRLVGLSDFVSCTATQQRLL